MLKTEVSVNQKLPVLPGASKRRSCELVTTTFPCVKKALHHLSNLNAILRENGGFLNHSDPSFTSSDAFAGKSSVRKRLRFASPALTLESGSDYLDDDLSVQGIGGQHPESETGTCYSPATRNQLSPQEVFNQVTELILRLENDRVVTERRLEQEKVKLEGLNDKIADMTQRRLIQLPIAVQKEHDACSRDIVELQWHVSYTQRQLNRIKDQVSVAQVLNTSLKDDIDFVKKHCPLVEEKLMIEKEAMKNIKNMQAETSKELADARIELDKEEARYQSAVEEAEAERKKTKGNLEIKSNKLATLKKELHHAKVMHTAYVKKVAQSRQKLSSQEEELVSLQEQTEQLRENEQQEMYKIEELRDQVRQVEFETGEVTKQKQTLETSIKKMEEDMEEKLAQLESKYKSKLRQLRESQERNREMQYDIEDTEEQIKSHNKAIGKTEKEIERYKKERERCENLLKEATDELVNVSMINSELRNTLEKEEAKSQALEDALKSTAETLRKQVNEEMRQRAALEVRRVQNTKALHKGKVENVKKQEKVTKSLEDSKQAVDKVKAEVEDLEKKHESTLKVISTLESKLSALILEHKTKEAALTSERDSIQPTETALQNEQISLKNDIKDIEQEESLMTQKLNDMKVSQTAMQKRIKITEENIEKLKEELDELQIRFETGEKTNKNMESQVESASKRLVEREKQHRGIIEERLKVKKELEEKVCNEVKENAKLAQQYRRLQIEHTDMKDRLMSLYDQRLELQIGIKDHKQLVVQQEKLNKALKQYYHDRGEFNKAGLNKFHIRSQNNTQLMKKVQEGLDISLDNISLFLKSQTDGSAVNRVRHAATEQLV